MYFFVFLICLWLDEVCPGVRGMSCTFYRVSAHLSPHRMSSRRVSHAERLRVGDSNYLLPPSRSGGELRSVL